MDEETDNGLDELKSGIHVSREINDMLDCLLGSDKKTCKQCKKVNNS